MKDSVNTPPSSLVVTSPATSVNQTAPAAARKRAGSAGPSNHLRSRSLAELFPCRAGILSSARLRFP